MTLGNANNAIDGRPTEVACDEVEVQAIHDRCEELADDVRALAALVVVPRKRITTSSTVGDAPRLSRTVKKWWKEMLVPEVCVFEGALTPSDDPAFIPGARLVNLPEAEATACREALAGNKLGGTLGFRKALL